MIKRKEATMEGVTTVKVTKDTLEMLHRVQGMMAMKEPPAKNLSSVIHTMCTDKLKAEGVIK